MLQIKNLLKVFWRFAESWATLARAKQRNLYFAAVIPLVFLFFGFYAYLFASPIGFPSDGVLFTVEKGESLSEVSYKLMREGVISRPVCLKLFATLMGRQKGVKAGDYFFEKPASCLVVAERVTRGVFGLVGLRITIPEGLNSKEIGELFSQKLPGFDAEKFVELAREKEGYLFPDTYFFFPNASPEEIIENMVNNFGGRVSELSDEIEKLGKSFGDVLTMASIIEDEATSSKDRRIVSGVLWERLRIGMPLQVDAPFRYLDGKGTFDLTRDDLATSSPYNTYNRRGLTPTPISNPGLDSILAAIYPTNTDYLYFVSDKAGRIYYAETFDEHQVNREKYLGR